MAVDTDFRAFVQAAIGTTVPMEKGRVSEEVDFAATPVRVYYQRANANTEVDLAGHGMIPDTTFDVEVGALTDEAAQPIATQIKALCNGYQGWLVKNSTWAQAVFVTDHNDDYAPRLFLDADQGIYGATFQVQVFEA